MSIIIQAGHKSSKSTQLMEKLYERGLSRPADSYTYKMTSEQVSETLCKVLSLEDMSSANDKMADNIMIDLLLANLDSENWGWESDKNLANLEYWGQVEPDVRFILVFDHPNNILKEFTNVALASDMVDQAMNEWVIYHQEMLRLLEEKSDNKIILIEGAYAIENIGNLGKQIKIIAKTLELKSSWRVISTVSDTKTVSNESLNKYSNTIKNHIHSEIVKKYPEVIKLFNTLLNKASLKSSEPIYKTKKSDVEILINSLNYLNKLEKNQLQKELVIDLETKLEAITYARDEAERKVSAHREKIDEYESKLICIKKSNNQDDASDEVIQITQKNMLVEQVYFLQEKIDEYSAENKMLLDRQKLANSSPVIPAKPVYYGAADRVKSSLQYRLGSKVVNSKTPKAVVSLPFILVKEYVEFQKKQNEAKGLPDLHDYQDIAEAKRVEKHLSYKLGKVMTDSLASPRNAFKLPISLSKELIDFKKK